MTQSPIRWTLRAALAVLAAVLSASPAEARQTTAAPEGWRLVWEDEFDGAPCPDSASWRYESGFVRNEELQWYQPENARCEHGYLVIEGRRERRPNPRYQAGSESWRTSRETVEYTSSSLLTRGRREWRYGRFEMRGRIDVRPGLWPAFWTLGVAGPWPSNGEVDVMEYYRGMILANVAWADESGRAVWDDLRKPLEELGDARWADAFHVWRMEWDEDTIRLYVDDLLLNETDIRLAARPGAPAGNPFHQPHYLILNLAIGGTNGGDPSATEFPARFEVDWVRVYQRE